MNLLTGVSASGQETVTTVVPVGSFSASVAVYTDDAHTGGLSLTLVTAIDTVVVPDRGPAPLSEHRKTEQDVSTLLCLNHPAGNCQQGGPCIRVLT